MRTRAVILPVIDSSPDEALSRLLQNLNGYPLIALTVQSALDSGAQNVCIIAEDTAAEIKTSLAHLATTETTDESLVQGLSAPPSPLQGSVTFAPNYEFMAEDAAPEAAFILPADRAGVRPRTFAQLHKQWETTKAAVLVPTYEGARGYPLLLSNSCLEILSAHGDEVSLEEVLAAFAWEELPVDDPGILLNTDTSESFLHLRQYVQKTRGISVSLAEELFAFYETPSNVRTHTKAVAAVAQRMAQELNKHSYGLDSELCRAGGDLHDLNRLEPLHSQVAAHNLQKLGYEALAEVVGAHDSELVLSPHMFTETNLVFVADKLVKENTLVRIEKRYEGALKRFPLATEIGKLIQKDSESAIALLKQYVSVTGDKALLEGTSDFVRGHYHAEA